MSDGVITVLPRKSEGGSTTADVAAPRPGVRTASVVTWGMRGGLAIVDQGLLSLSHFLLSLLLARWLSPPEYGAFAVAFSAYLFFAAIHSGLLQEPMSVFAPASLANERFSRYQESLLPLHGVVSVGLAIPSAIVAFLLYASIPSDSWGTEYPDVLLALSLVLPVILLLPLVRRLAYLHGTPVSAVVVAGYYAGGVILGLVLLNTWGTPSAPAAFGIMGAAAALATVRYVGSRTGNQFGLSGIRDALREHWRIGKWLVALGVLTWLSWDTYYVLAAGMIGPEEAGALRAVSNLVTPLQQSLTAVGVLLLPWFSNGSAKLTHAHMKLRATQVTRLLVFLSLGYFALIAVFSESLLRLLYGGEYAEYVWMVPWVTSVQVLRACCMGAILALVASQQTKAVFVAGLSGAAATLGVGPILIQRWGDAGLVAGLFLSGLSSAVTLLVLYRRAAHRIGQGAHLRVS